MNTARFSYGRILLFAQWGLVSLVASGLHAQIETAGELFVDLDAADPSAGGELWANRGTLDDFVRVGDPLPVVIDGAAGVSFNEGLSQDAYQSQEDAPEGLVGPDPTRSIEVWAYNVDIANEETLVAWGRRGGPAGTNMSFNYGTNTSFGAVGHWDFPDIGWRAVPPPLQWNHLVYTYDGTTTRVYSNGVETNSEELGPGVIDTHAGTKITLAQQILADGVGLDFSGRSGTLSIGRVRVHDGVLAPEQVTANFLAEADEFGVLETPPLFLDPPEDDTVVSTAIYSRTVRLEGFPFPEVSLTAPAGGMLVQETPLRYTVTFDLPDPAPDFFDVALTASSAAGDDDASWRVSVRRLPPPGEVAVAGELFVDLDAADPSAGSDVWTNAGTLDDFERVGAPVVVTIEGAQAVSFNEAGRSGDAYQSFDVAPEGLVGPDPTRTIEVWVYNPQIADEETLVAWGRRGGPDGTNMSFNYGQNGLFGAVGHWGAPDIGWGTVPLPAQWHHLVYTFDGATTRVYADGAETNSEEIGPGIIDTYGETRITLAAQILGDGIGLDVGPREGTLAIGRVRVHDGVLSPEEILHNFELENDDFTVPDVPPSFAGVPGEDFVFTTSSDYARLFTTEGFPEPEVTLVEPAGAVLTRDAPFAHSLAFELPDPPPASFDVRLTATNVAGTTMAEWTVAVREPPSPGDPIETAGELFVLLDAAHETAGTVEWENQGTLGNFVAFGAPALVEHEGAPAVAFNQGDILGDAYESVDDAPAGLVGRDPTRSIEVWVYNPQVANEETLVAWSRRGGPLGSNMSFNYGTNPNFGAVGHWGLFGPDLGWGVTPLGGQWHHLVYTYDGATTRVYADGEETNSEFLGRGAIDTHAGTRIALASQYLADGISLDVGDRSGTLSIGRVRIHDEVLRPEQVRHNFQEERSEFPLPLPPEPEPLEAAPIHRYSFTDGPEDSIGGADGTAFGDVIFADGQALLQNDGTQLSADGTGAYIDLPDGMISALGNRATFETWLTWNGPAGSSWQRIFDFGISQGGPDVSDTAANQFYLFLTPRSGDNTLRAGYRDQGALVGTERSVNAPPLEEGIARHVTLVWDGAATTATLYLDGLKVDEDTQVHIALSDILDDNNWLGRSQWGPDPMLSGSYDEFRIYDDALTAGQVLGNFEAGPDVLQGLEEPPAGFIRGDIDSSGGLNITDAIVFLGWQFLGDPPPPCLDAADVDDSGSHNITDAIFLLQFQFLGTAPPVEPGPTPGEPLTRDNCGPDPTADDFDCAEVPPLCGE